MWNGGPNFFLCASFFKGFNLFLLFLDIGTLQFIQNQASKFKCLDFLDKENIADNFWASWDRTKLKLHIPAKIVFADTWAKRMYSISIDRSDQGPIHICLAG